MRVWLPSAPTAQIHIRRFFPAILPMPEPRSDVTLGPVYLVVDDLPPDVAEEIREVQHKDPEFLRRILLYGITYKAVFETLHRGWRG
jgi:hypothetical protein